MADLVDEFLYLTAKVESDFEQAVLDTPVDLRAERWYGDWSMRETALHLATWDELDAEYLEAIAAGDQSPARRWSGPEETDSFNAALINEHSGEHWRAVMAYATVSRRRLHEALEGLRRLAPERFWESGSQLRGRAMHSATHRTHHLLPILEWHASEELRRGG